ncbi:hypothetical protein [Vibrio cholerae]|uniref:hypothetical protein n=1 Tax=Vibrio cholerae TaxID=666 RepID=UPI0011D6B428|nr:hypothetical protein [Vibrio cholerae]TXX49212.1 hypothetical protein FXF14_08335 [Vibrio cholerae]
MQVLMNGTHIEFVMYVLEKMGYSNKDLNHLGLYPCLIRLISEDTVEEIQTFLDTKHEYMQEILQSHGLDSFIYLLQMFVDPIVWSTNPKQTLDELFEDAQDKLNKEIGCGVIRMGIE